MRVGSLRGSGEGLQPWALGFLITIEIFIALDESHVKSLIESPKCQTEVYSFLRILLKFSFTLSHKMFKKGFCIFFIRKRQKIRFEVRDFG